MLYLKGLTVLTILIVHALPSPASKATTRFKRNVIFPPVSGMGLFLAIAVPVDLPQYELSMSYNFEGNYLLPGNATELSYGPTVAQARSVRSITRTRVYNVLEERLESSGLLGRDCLLRTICETAATPITGHNGLIGDLVHILFTPSSSEAENLPDIYQQAENTGIHHGKDGCLSSYSQCPFSLYELFSQWEDT